MVRVRQHGDDDQLQDINLFLSDIDTFFEVDEWIIDIEWCLGEGSAELENVTKGGKSFTDKEFRKIYKPIYQTIDGKLELLSNKQVVAKLEAIDSSYWEISSSELNFEKHMNIKYGKYEYNKT